MTLDRRRLNKSELQALLTEIEAGFNAVTTPEYGAVCYHHMSQHGYEVMHTSWGFDEVLVLSTFPFGFQIPSTQMSFLNGKAWRYEFECSITESDVDTEFWICYSDDAGTTWNIIDKTYAGKYNGSTVNVNIPSGIGRTGIDPITTTSVTFSSLHVPLEGKVRLFCTDEGLPSDDLLIAVFVNWPGGTSDIIGEGSTTATFSKSF
jgi:hypothetical protein